MAARACQEGLKAESGKAQAAERVKARSRPSSCPWSRLPGAHRGSWSGSCRTRWVDLPFGFDRHGQAPGGWRWQFVAKLHRHHRQQRRRLKDGHAIDAPRQLFDLSREVQRGGSASPILMGQIKFCWWERSCPERGRPRSLGTHTHTTPKEVKRDRSKGIKPSSSRAFY